MYYMNKPCKILKKVTEEVTEILVYPEYIGSAELCGSQWCTPCQIGGTSTHTCSEWQDSINEVIDAIESSEREPVVMMVYAKHLHENQSQVETIVALEEFIKTLKSDIKEKKGVKQDLINYEIQIKKIKDEIELKNNLLNGVKKLKYEKNGLIDIISDLRLRVLRLSSEVKRNKNIIEAQQVKKNDTSITISMTEFNRLMSLETGVRISEDELERFEKIEHKMLALEHGGVDNWEWYGESISNYEKANDIEL